ncbi:MAG: dihydrolipoamide acetyltransferase family protein, partial [Ardenticatenales bacterium]
AATSAAATSDAPMRAMPDMPDLSRNLGFISPRVARVAAENGVDLRYVAGTGKDDRITARDVERFVAAGGMAAVAAASAAPAAASAAATTMVTDAAPSAVPASVPTATASPSAPAPAPAPATAPEAASAAASAAASSGGGAADFIGQIMPLTRMRRLIADHMVKSMQTSPHVTTVHEVDMGAAMAAYKAQKDGIAARGGRLTVTAIIIECVAKALERHPMVNSAWTDEGVRIHRDINIGMAVAIADGLMVPVIKQANAKSLSGLAADINDLAKRARDGALRPDDIQGGTFTITNYGTLGSLFGTPVINQPQCAILGAGAIKKRVVVVETKHGDQMAIRPMMYLALTFDHRILDGGTADPFMRTVTELLEGYGA